MITLLYRENEPTAFRKFHNPCETVVDMETDTVKIFDKGTPIGKYHLIKRHNPMWTDETKSDAHVMVKLVVSEWPDTWETHRDGNIGIIKDSPEYSEVKDT